MQILHYCTHLQLTDGGVNRAVLDLSIALSKRVKSVSLMTTEGKDWPSSGTGVQTMQTGPFDRSSNRFTSHRLSTLKQYIDAADVLHLHQPWEPATLQVAQLARTTGTPYVISTHGKIELMMMKNLFRKRIFFFFPRPSKELFYEAAAVHCTTNLEMDRAKSWIPKANLKVMPFVFDPSEFLYPPPTSDPDKYWPQRTSKKPIVLFLSQLHPNKGIEHLIKSAAEIVKNNNVRFIIAGGGDSEYVRCLRNLTAELQLNEDVEFAGYVEGDRKIALLRAANLFVFPTFQETDGLVIPEAMASGLPVLTTKHVYMWPELEQSGGVKIIDGSIEQLVPAIMTLLADETSRKVMGSAGKTWAKQTFASDEVVNRYIVLYRSIIDQ